MRRPIRTEPVIRLGIGDVTEPLPRACLEALHAATDEMGQRATFQGYGPEQGYAFLREAIAQHDYAARGCEVAPDEIFVSDGAKCDCGNIQEIFAQDARLAIPDPVYPVYLDTNVMAGRTGRQRRRPLRGRHLPRQHAGQRLRAGGAAGAGGPHLPVLPEQSDRRGRDPRPARRVGGVRAGEPRDHPLRLGLRGVHPRPADPAQHL